MTDLFLPTPNTLGGESADTPTPVIRENFDHTPPQILDTEDMSLQMSAYLQPVLEYPSDRIICRTVTLNNNDPNGPALLANRQIEGVGSRVVIRNTGASGVVWILTSNESASPSGSATQIYSDGFPLAVGSADLVLVTRNAIWAIAPGAAGTAQVSLIIHTYLGDQK